MASKNWFKGAQVQGFSRACRDRSLRGAMLGARREGAVMEDGAHLYVTGQFSNGLTPPELREILMADLQRMGVQADTLICAQTWFSGATFSHELVSSVVERCRQSVQDLARLPS